MPPLKTPKSETEDKIRIEITDDHFKAFLHLPRKKAKLEKTSLIEIHNLLKEYNITFGIKDYEKIQDFLDEPDVYDYVFPIAVGTPFEHGQDGEIIYYFGRESTTPSNQIESTISNIDFHNFRRTVNTIKKGDLLAEKVGPMQGKGGITVHGQTLPGEWGVDVLLFPGENVEVSQNGTQFTAAIDGSPHVAKNVISVKPVQTIYGGIDFSTGNVDFAGAIEIKGSIMDGFSVKAGGNIIVEDSIQAANVQAGGDIIVGKGILTRSKGIISAEGDIHAKFIENSIVKAEGDIFVQNAIINSEIYCNGKVVALLDEGTIMGGKILSYDQVAAKVIGSSSGSQTIIQIGLRYEIQAKYTEIKQQIARIFQQLSDLKKGIAHLDKTTRGIDFMPSEKALQARKIAGELVKKQKQLQDEMIEIRAQRIFNQLSKIEGRDVIYPGTTIFFGDFRVNVDKELPYSSFKWDVDTGVYLTVYDEKGKQLGSEKPVDAKTLKTVLIVDDSKTIRKTLRLILEKSGVKVIGEAPDGEIGIQMFKNLKPSLVTCDIAMVNKDGIETLKEIKKEDPKAKVLMISSNKDQKQVLECIMNGALDYILKPFNPQKVMTAVLNALEME